MTETIRTDPFSSVYVLDAHSQNASTANVFNSAAGRAIVSDFLCSEKSPVHKYNRRQGSSDFPKYLLNNSNITEPVQNNNRETAVWVFEEDERRGSVKIASADGPFVPQSRLNNENFVNGNLPIYSDEEHLERQDSGRRKDIDENRNVPNATLTRRNVSQKEEGPSDVYLTIQEDDEQAEVNDEDARIDEKISRLRSHYERGFGTDEKCDILKRMLTGFLTGIVYAKSATSRKKRKSSNDLYTEASYALGIPCELTDSCRCLDCQCNYFDCGDTSSMSSEMSVNLNDCDVEEWPCEEEKIGIEDVFHVEDEVAGHQPETEAPPPREGAPEEAPPPEVAPEMAAGTPVLLDHLLNTPLSCLLQ